MESDFKHFVEEKRTWYKRVGIVFCPVLNVDVVFNAQGFRHLRYNGLGQARPVADQISRMELLKVATEIVTTATSIFEHRRRYEKTLRKYVDYWEIQKIIDDKLITVIVRQVGTGHYIFYSIWRNRK